jgi:glucose-1-phosphatase
MIKTLIFDLGKVIVNFDHSRIVQRIEQSCDFKSDEIFKIIFASNTTHDYELGKISSLEFFDEVKKLINLRMSFTEFADAWTCTFDLEPIISEKIIENLSQKYRLLVLSDTNELHFEFIKVNFPILRHFDDFVLSYQVGVVKPAPEIFYAAIEKANCLPEECFFTDDREVNVIGAEKVGIKAIQFISAEQFVEDLQNLT